MGFGAGTGGRVLEGRGVESAVDSVVPGPVAIYSVGRVEKSGNGGGNGRPPVNVESGGGGGGGITACAATGETVDAPVGASSKISTILVSSFWLALFIGAPWLPSEPSK